MSSSISAIYKTSLALLTDLYQLTMANGYFCAGVFDQRAVFHLHFRKNPFGGGFSVAAGLGHAIELLEGLRFDASDLEYLATLRGNDQAPLFGPAFLARLGALRFSCDVDAVPEGTVVFPGEPLLRIQGPIAECQLLETALLTVLNFETLIATKAARVTLAAGSDPVLEFGLRRAQGVDGALAASRAAYIGGTSATSNVLAGKLYGIPVRGTHAHSWVMFFEDEPEAFRQYAAAMPNNCVFLVDTYDTLEGVRRAIEVGQELRARGHRLAGIRLDSGDLAYLSREARRLLDAAGFDDAAIIASNDLDEHLITSLKTEGAKIGIWGVGTKLVTAYDQPALGGVYKLGAVQSADGRWHPRIKLSEQAAKVSTPGIQNVRRFLLGGEYVGDAIWDESLGLSGPPRIIDPLDPTRQKQLPSAASGEDLLVPVFRGGQRVMPVETLDDARRRRAEQLGRFHGGIKRFLNPHQYPVGLESALYKSRAELIRRARGLRDEA